MRSASSYDVVNAVLAADADDVVDAVARAQAVKGVLHLPEFQSIAAACKRMRNILEAGEGSRDRSPPPRFRGAARFRPKKRTALLPNSSYAAKSRSHAEQKAIIEQALLDAFDGCDPPWMHFSTRSWSWSKTSESGPTVWRFCKLC